MKKLTGVNTRKDEGLIYVQVPHQMRTKAYAFADEDAFLDWLRKTAKAGFNWQEFTEEEWIKDCRGSGESEDSAWWKTWAQPGIDLFRKGAEKIVSIWYSETSHELFDAKKAPTEREALLESIHDFHTHYILGKEEVTGILWGGPELIRHDHQRFETFTEIRKAAEQLGWVEPKDEKETEVK